MGVQFGKWNFDGHAPFTGMTSDAQRLLTPYSSDGNCVFRKSGMCIVHCGLDSTEQSSRELQTFHTASGLAITWDGDLDNRLELLGHLEGNTSMRCPDVYIVATGYDRWGTGLFGKLVGDWALSLYDTREQT